MSFYIILGLIFNILYVDKDIQGTFNFMTDHSIIY